MSLGQGSWRAPNHPLWSRTIGKEVLFSEVYVSWRDERFPLLRRMLSPDDDLTCSNIRNFRQLLRSEICAANVCQSTKNTKDKYGNLDWGRIHWIYNMSAIDENRDGESMNPLFLGLRRFVTCNLSAVK